MDNIKDSLTVTNIFQSDDIYFTIVNLLCNTISLVKRYDCDEGCCAGEIIILKLTVAELNLEQYIQISVSDRDLYCWSHFELECNLTQPPFEQLEVKSIIVW